MKERQGITFIQKKGEFTNDSILSATVLIPLIVIVLLIVLLCVGYVKAPPDMAYIISGVKKKSKVVIGKASIRIPFFELSG